MPNPKGLWPRPDDEAVNIVGQEPAGTPLRKDERASGLAFARTSFGITLRDGGTCRAESSVYGAALVIPQMARTVGWDRTMTALAISSWMFLIINAFLQFYLLSALAKEQLVMDPFAGQMYLCDFGASLVNCPGPGCTGPGGTDVTAPRLYSYDSWVNRNFVKSSLQSLFPERADEIATTVDPGEYGVEDFWCRLICCFIFMIPLMQDLNGCIKMAQLLYYVPTCAEPWIVPKDEADDELDSESKDLGQLSDVRLRIGGMPLYWKIFDFCIIIIPKLVLWKVTAQTGILFLMETSDITDTVVNSVGLTFILSLDELICGALMSEEISLILEQLEDFPLYDKKTSCVGDMSLLTDDEILELHVQHRRLSLTSWTWADIQFLIPTQLLASLLLTFIFVCIYYNSVCVRDDLGRWVSKDMFLPKSAQFTMGQALLPSFFNIPAQSEPFWSKP